MKILIRLLCVSALILALASCDKDEKVSTLPSFAGFRVSPEVWNTGDSVTITAVQRTHGDLLYKAIYHWSVACVDTTFTKEYEVTYDADKSDPYIGFRIPEKYIGKQAEISFNAQYSFSAQTPASVPAGGNGEQTDVHGKISTSVASQLYGRAIGTYTHRWP